MILEERWLWKTDWCRKNSLNPHFAWVWDLAEEALEKYINANNR